jgi:hypothetical protein
MEAKTETKKGEGCNGLEARSPVQESTGGTIKLWPETVAAIEALKDSSVPWICRGCDKTLATCGKSVEKCEYALWKANESERSWGRA